MITPAIASKLIAKAVNRLPRFRPPTKAELLRFGPETRGVYRGKPLRPGVHSGDGDFLFLKDTLVAKGYTPEQASRIAGRQAQRVLSSQGMI